MLAKLNSFLTTLIPQSAEDSRPEHTLQLATAALLIEVMRSDGSTDEEQATVLGILRQRFGLSESEVARLSELGHHSVKAANDLHQFTSLLNRELNMEEKIRLLEYLWQVAYADGVISAHEEHILRKIAGLLYISHGNFIAAKLRVKPATGS